MSAAVKSWTTSYSSAGSTGQKPPASQAPAGVAVQSPLSKRYFSRPAAALPHHKQLGSIQCSACSVGNEHLTLQTLATHVEQIIRWSQVLPFVRRRMLVGLPVPCYDV